MKKSLGPKPLALPLPVWVIGVYDPSGRPNAMTASWAGMCCSKPPCLSVSIRAATYTHGCIMASKAFTVSVPSEAHAAQTDYFGAVSGRDKDKFAETGLTPVRAERVNAPYVGEFPVAIECRVVHVAELGLHTQFVGEIMDVKVEAGTLSEAGTLDIQAVRPIIYCPGTRTYHGLGVLLGRAGAMAAR
ncbi:MAG: flavin reductase family protein [Desulfovibrionaceae bacterium]|nr:flavin reductase family protein [Desulfovibrionaceae bacterium]